MSVLRKTPCPAQKRLQTGIFGFSQKEIGAKGVAWQQYSRCHFVSFLMYITGAKFEDHCSNISSLRKQPSSSAGSEEGRLFSQATIFLEIFLIQYFIVLVERSMTSSLPSFA